jgi:hypothetical protein
MKKSHLAIVTLAGILFVTSCGTAHPPTQDAAPRSSPNPTEAWKTYTNAEAGFSIRYPSSWRMEPMPDENAGLLHRVSFQGQEGGIELDWGTGIGGACPEGYQPLELAQGDLPVCHSQSADGTEQWSLAGKQLDGISFGGNAYTSDASPASRDLVLRVLATLSFP